MRKLLLPATLALLTSCSLIPDYQRPAMDVPAGWSGAAVNPTCKLKALPMDWWKSFNDPALTALVEEGLNANDDLYRAAARVAEARAIVSQRQSDQLPTVYGQADVTRTSNSREAHANGNFTPSSKPYNDFSLAIVLEYEVDLWGRLRSATQQARAQLLASEATQGAIRLSVASDVANAYFNLSALDAQIAVNEQTIKSREESLRYQQAQYNHGAVDKLTYKQAEAELADARAVLPTLVQARTEQESALKVLLGKSPKEIVEKKITPTATPDAMPVPPVLPPSLPSDLLERRPDIQAAEQNLIASYADIGVVRTQYFPRLSLSGLIGLSSSEASKLLRSSARNWDAGVGLVGPLVDFGGIAADVDAAKARRDQALADYRQTVRNSFKDVVDALEATKNTAAQVEAQNTQVAARAETLKLAEVRYKAGYTTHLELLDSERSLFNAQLNRISARRDQLTAAVNLYKSLGGGWVKDEEKK